MKKNIGSTDYIIRLVIATVIVILYFRNIITGTWALILGIAAFLLIVTASFRTCPLYLPFGITTLKKKKDEKQDIK